MWSREKYELNQAELAAAQRMLIADEGIKLVPYICTGGYWTIGVGHKITGLNGQAPKGIRWTLEQALEQLKSDIIEHWIEVLRLFGFDFVASLPTGRKLALLTLMYTLGSPKLRTFHQTIPAIKEGRWEEAARLLLQTKWARDVDPHQREGIGRDDRISRMLLTGEVDPNYLG